MGNSLYVLYIIPSVTCFDLRYNDIIYNEKATSWVSWQSTITYTHTQLCVVRFGSLKAHHNAMWMFYLLIWSEDVYIMNN